MTRDELITIAVNARVLANEDEIDSVLDVLEPIIRADEREKKFHDMDGLGMDLLRVRKRLTDLRAEFAVDWARRHEELREQVRKLPARGLEVPHATGTRHVLVWRDDVLDLIGGSE